MMNYEGFCVSHTFDIKKLLLLYSMIVLYSRDHKGVDVAHENITQKPTSLFPDDDEAVLVRQN